MLLETSDSVHIDCGSFPCLFGYFTAGTDKRLGHIGHNSCFACFTVTLFQNGVKRANSLSFSSRRHRWHMIFPGPVHAGSAGQLDASSARREHQFEWTEVSVDTTSSSAAAATAGN
ncbi:hypothetical protein TYRP_016343 [Tyrophagus putrescentiae]|nr:hypothetical protein TYRP_016343 [Tyrophagus putrescentiae]